MRLSSIVSSSALRAEDRRQRRSRDRQVLDRHVDVRESEELLAGAAVEQNPGLVVAGLHAKRRQRHVLGVRDGNHGGEPALRRRLLRRLLLPGILVKRG